jgi:curved DNA-binding protein CbpA
MSDWQDYYKILGINRNATQQEIKEAYRYKAHTVHPDKVPETFKQRAEDEFKQVNEAHGILKDPQKRNIYNLDYDQRIHSDAKNDTSRQGQIIKPTPIADPLSINLGVVEAGEIETASFIIRNEGGPYTKLWFSNPDSWIKVVNYAPVNDYGQLPYKVWIEAKGQEWGKNYLEYIKVKLDEEEIAVRVELRTRPKPQQTTTPYGARSSPTKSTRKRHSNLLDINNPRNQNTIFVAALIIGILLAGPGFLSNNKSSEIIRVTAFPTGSQVAGSLVMWTVTANDPENKLLLYKFLLKGPSTSNTWQEMASWSNNNSWIWNTSKEDVGENLIKIQIRDKNYSEINGFDAENITRFLVTEPLKLPIIRSLTPSLSSPQYAGSAITWTVDVYNSMDVKLYYRFSLTGPSTEGHKLLMTKWTTNNWWTWETKSSDKGDYQICIEIKYKNYENLDEFDAYKKEDFTLANTPPDSPTLESEKLSPQIEGTVITWWAVSSDPNNDKIYYRFLINGPSTGNIWKITKDWSTSNTWIWTTSSSDNGENMIKVQVRDSYLRDSERFDAEETADYIIDAAQPIENNPLPISESSSQALSQPETQYVQEIDHSSAGKSSLSTSIQPTDGSGPRSESAPLTEPEKTSAKINKAEPRNVIKIGAGIKPSSKTIHLGDEAPRKMIYI